MTQATPIRDLKGYLLPEQVKMLIAVAKTLRDILLVLIPWRTGIRVGKLIRIRVPDVDFENRAILIKMRKRDGKAVERRRIVPVDRSTLDMIKEYLEWRRQFPGIGSYIHMCFAIASRSISHVSPK